MLLSLDSIFLHGLGLLPLAAVGAAVGVVCVRVAMAYANTLVAGGHADAVSMRAAFLHGLCRPGSGSRVRGVAVACAALMSFCVVTLHVLYGYTPYFLGSALACAILLLLALIDARTRLLPDALTLPLLWLGLAMSWAGYGLELHDAVAGAMLGYGFLWLLFWLFKWLSQREGMGYGDFKLLAALGAWLGWRPLAVVLLAACVMGLIFAMFMQKSFRPTGSYPFGPFLAASGIAALMAGSGVHLYFW